MSAPPPSSPAGARRSRARFRVIAGILAAVVLLVIAGVMVRRATNPQAVERRLLAMLGPSGDSLYHVRVGSSRLSVLGGSYLATGIEITPDSAAFRLRREAGRPVRSRVALQAASFKVTGLGMWGLFRNRIAAATAVVDSLLLEVYLDRTVPGIVDSLKRLPHELFQSLAQPVRIDTFRFENSEFRYSERAMDGARPGTIRFTQSRVGVFNLTNDTLRPHPPVIIDLQTRLAGSAPVKAVFEYDFATPKLNLDYQGSIGDLEARELNEMTVDLEGIRLTGGHMDSAWFKFRVKDGVANGEFQMLYRDLEAEFLDKVTGQSGLSAWLKTFVAGAFMLRGSNRREGDEAARTVAIRGFARGRDIPLTKYVWHTLREGLFVTIKGEPPKASPNSKSREIGRPRQ